MNIFKLLADPSPGGLQDKNRIVIWLIPKCAIFSGNTWTWSRLLSPALIIPLSLWSYDASLLAFIFFAITDWIDGKVARYKEEDKGAGVWFDPLADKVFIIPLFCWFGLFHQSLIIEDLFWFMVWVEVGGRVFIQLVWWLSTIMSKASANRFGGGLLIKLAWWLGRKKGDMSANWYGKIKMGLQVALVPILQVFPRLSDIWWLHLTLFSFINILMLWIIVLGIISAIGYIIPVWEPIKKRKPASL